MRFFILLLLSFLPPAVAFAGPFEDAKAAYSRQDYEVALKIWMALAKQGRADAQNNIGMLYAQGQGVPLDLAEAKEWFEKSAAQGDAKAQCNLGQMYQMGVGVPQDYAKAQVWLEKAANQGTAKAQDSLGEMYAQGLGVKKDLIQAYFWISLAEAPGDDDMRSTSKEELDDIRVKMTPEQINEAKTLIREHKPTPAPARAETK